MIMEIAVQVIGVLGMLVMGVVMIDLWMGGE